MRVQTYLYFDGHCEEALDFYRRNLDAEVLMSMRFSENPVPPNEKQEQDNCAGGQMPPWYEDKIMHCCFRIGETEIMASDGFCGGKLDFQGFGLSLVTADKAEAEHKFALLAEGGEVKLPMEQTFFSPAFGMVTDRFGVLWNVLAEPLQQ